MIPSDFMHNVDRFWSKVDRSGECWIWRGELHRAGYGFFAFWHEDRRTRILAHRLALKLSGVAVEDGDVVRHACDNPPCVNPAHLSVGTQADNIADAIARGRLDTTGLRALTEKHCLTCGEPFMGVPSSRYCEAHKRTAAESCRIWRERRKKSA